MSEFVTVAMGHKDSHGWSVDDRIDVQCFDTGISQIVITPDLRGSSYNLTHVGTGFYLLGPFDTLTQARQASVKLAKLLPLSDMTQNWTRADAKRMFRALPVEAQEWMRSHGAKL